MKRKFLSVFSILCILLFSTGCSQLINGLNEKIKDSTADPQYPTVEIAKENVFDHLRYGESVTLTVNAYTQDLGSLSYQWYKTTSDKKNGTPISGATSDSYTYTAPNKEVASTYYYCKVTNTLFSKTADVDSDYYRIIVTMCEKIDSVEEDDELILNPELTYRVSSNISISGKLTIPAGTVIKFTPDCCLDVTNNGIIIAEGTEEKGIIFTSWRDDSVGIKISDGESPVAGDWDYIEINGATGSKFEYCTFCYAGNYEYFHGALKLERETNVKNCTFAYNKSQDGALYISSGANGSTVKYNTFYANDYPVKCSVNFNLTDTNVFHNSDETLFNNKAAIWVYYSSVEEGKTYTLAETEIPYLLKENTNVYGTLEIKPGVKVMFTPEAFLETHYDGIIKAEGTEENGIIFTSWRDTGVSNISDGVAPDAGDWNCIYIGGASGSKFEHCTFRYAGNYEYFRGALRLERETNVKNCTFAYNKSKDGALYIDDGADDTTVTDSLFYANDGWPITCIASISLGSTNTFTKEGEDLNRNQGIRLIGSNISYQVAYEETEVPFYSENGLYINDGISVYFSGDVIIKFGKDKQLDSYGVLYFDSNVILTSIFDDEHGGDTNADGDSTTPTDGDWEGVWIEDEYWNNTINKNKTIVFYNNPKNIDG